MQEIDRQSEWQKSSGQEWSVMVIPNQQQSTMSSYKEERPLRHSFITELSFIRIGMNNKCHINHNKIIIIRAEFQ